jgi:hypothetical protein
MEGVSLLMGYTSTTNGKDEDDYVVDNLMIDVEDKTGDRVRSPVSGRMYPIRLEDDPAAPPVLSIVRYQDHHPALEARRSDCHGFQATYPCPSHRFAQNLS